MEQPEKKHYTVDEYFDLEELTEIKNEFSQGKIIKMPRTSINHSRILGNIVAALDLLLKNELSEIFASNLRVWIKEKDLFTYPDIMVVCESPQFYPKRNDTITNPLVIMEVLSESTRNYDRGDKFMFYRSLSSFKEYVLIDQYAVHIEHFYIGEQGKWTLNEYDSIDEILTLTKIDFQMPVQDICNKVEFQTAEDSDQLL